MIVSKERSNKEEKASGEKRSKHNYGSRVWLQLRKGLERSVRKCVEFQ